ncbi:flagellar biosynthetic protein FliO [Paenibacillus lautus]|uniref:Flagellar protein n=1 Tax=Paenibacillus lautus TaxID=1401 RepID=A0A385TJ06_PAELA|nr:flagellar biosynthetic protein FliO [Paenibacillus lautus]AYB43481.1 flagellar protein [Paenibacillus lautus]MBY0161024.1 flagellar biosynthetic protein FliO [Cytobacillus firmus]MCI1773436.1 flagellar biosynthetic protein FliO [Paenibacillus lautus]VTR58421.1 flagella biosynthesis protein FliZ [Actinobacillus pleuropneumoniae]
MMMAASDRLGSSSTTGYYLQLFYVFIVLAIIIALIVFLIRFLGRKNQSWMQGRSIRTLGAVGMGPNKSLQLVEIGGSIYVIGVGEDVRLVDKISDPAEVALIQAAFEQDSGIHNGALPPFISKLAAKLRKDKPPEEMELDDTSSFHEVFESKLRSVPNRKEKVEELLREDHKDS